MKIEELRLLIREELRTVMQEELREILTEAVKIASTPEAPRTPLKLEEPTWVSELKMNTATSTVREQEGMSGQMSAMDLLKETARSMTSEDLRNMN